jgi:hypothetical protein
MPVAHAVMHAPQWLASPSEVSQPSIGSLLQSPHPGAQDEDGNAQRPASQLVGPLTWASCVQSLPQPPQVCTSLGEAQVPAAPQVSWDDGHAQSPHWQFALHFWLPPVPQFCVASGMHAPSPLHADQLLQLPFMQLRVCMPHNPHGCIVGPVHDGATTVPFEGGGDTTGVGADDQSPQGGTDWDLAAHAVLTTQVPPCAAALVHAPAGSWICPPDTVQSLPSLNTTQHAVALQTPPAPAGNCSATFSFDASAPEGNASAQEAAAAETAWALAKHPCTSKHPADTDASPVMAGDGGTEAGGTTAVTQEPCTQVWPLGQLELTLPSALVCAVPTHR